MVDKCTDSAGASARRLLSFGIVVVVVLVVVLVVVFTHNSQFDHSYSHANFLPVCLLCALKTKRQKIYEFGFEKALEPLLSLAHVMYTWVTMLLLLMVMVAVVELVASCHSASCLHWWVSWFVRFTDYAFCAWNILSSHAYFTLFSAK